MRSAVVAGAGIGGLAIAGALARQDWRVTLLERDDRLRSGRAALLLWPNGVDALRELGLGGGLDAIASPVPDRGIRRPDGQWIAQPGSDGAAGLGTPVVVHQEDLHDALIAGLKGRIEIVTNAAVRTVRMSSSELPAVTAGASTYEADLVIGADGVGSVVRKRLAPESAIVPAGCAAWRAVIPWYRAGALAEQIERAERARGAGAKAGELLGGETVGPGGHRFRYATLGSRGSAGGASARGGIYWVATVPGAARPESAAMQLTLLQRWFAGWHAPISDIIAATGADDLVQQDVSELWPVPRAFSYHAGKGGYALIGDAAHAMAHHLGQGACLAIEDAVALARALRGVTDTAGLGDALDAYSLARRPRVLRIARQSRRVGAVLTSGKATARTADAAQGVAPTIAGRASQVLRNFRRS